MNKSRFLISGEYPQLGEALHRLDIETISTKTDVRLPKPISFHPDMQCCRLSDCTFVVLKNGPLEKRLDGAGLGELIPTIEEPKSIYPKDVLCNGVIQGKWLIGNPETLDKAVLNAAKRQNKKIIKVGQGYTACSVVMVDSQSAITADSGIAQALEENDFEVLRIQPGFIRLPGYDTGFIGGCYGKLSATKFAFSGKLLSHPDGERIRNFLNYKGICTIELTDYPLFDMGGMISLN